MTSHDSVFVPFWVLIDFLDASKYEPFIKCTIIKNYSTKVTPTESAIPVFDLEIKPGLVAEAVPQEYTIEKKDLKAWATKISNWILEFPEAIDAN